MDKMRMETPDFTATNVEKIGSLFPNCVTETTDENGRFKKAINFDLLRQMLSGDVVEGDEAYEFTWVGKKSAIVEANKPIRKTLRPCLEASVNWETTENLYIEGDNLEALKLLQESYLGKIKLIYIDPPYNTGGDFIYCDDFRISLEDYKEHIGNYGENEERLFKNTDSNGRFHSDWCSMMYPRIMLARNMLSLDGAIFISIDDHEEENLKKICDEIFGIDCFVANISWQRTYSMRNDSKGIPSEVEHILVYSKSAAWSPHVLPRTAEMDSKYKNPDDDPNGAWQNTSAFAPGAITHQGMVYGIQHPFTGEIIYPTMGACWRYQQGQMLEYMNGWCEYELRDLDDADKRAKVCGIDEMAVKKDVKGIMLKRSLEESKEKAKIVLNRGQWPRFFFTNNGKGGIRRKTYLDSVGGKPATNYWAYSDVGHTDEAKKELMALFGGTAPFDTPKPIRLMERILTIASDEDSIILDFFSGSASMAHAVIEKNKSDYGHRKFIMVQIPEKISFSEYDSLCDVGEERIRRAGLRIKENMDFNQKLDIGFRVFKVDESNMNDVYYSAGDYTQEMISLLESNIKPDRTDLDLLFGCVLDWGLPLSLPYTSEEIDGCTVHTYNDGDLVACFNENVPESVIKEIAKRQPLRAVFRDSSFASSPAKINVGEIFKMLAPDTSVKVI